MLYSPFPFDHPEVDGPMGEVAQDLPAYPPRRMRCSHRGPEDDFFCLRYQVWYPSFDCAVRTRFRTSDGCGDCEQGRFNLKRHQQLVDVTPFRFQRFR